MCVPSRKNISALAPNAFSRGSFEWYRRVHSGSSRVSTLCHRRTVPGRALTTAADHSFVNGVHMAVTGGAILAGLSAFAVARWLPRELTHEGVDVAVVEEFV